MPRLHDPAQHAPRWRIWLAVSGCFLALLLSCTLGLVGVQQRWFALPAFGARLGPLLFTSCLPRWEMTSSLGCVSDNGNFRRPSEIWLEIDAPPHNNRRTYRLITIPAQPGR